MVRDVRVLGAIGVVEIKDFNWEDIFQIRKDFANQGIWLRPFGDVIYITLNSGTDFDKKSSNKICEEISKFFNVECVIDVFSYYK